MLRELFDEIIIDAEKTRIKLTYYMITDSVREEYCDLKVYGAEIDKEEFFSENVCERESKMIKNLFFRKAEAEEFLKKLSSGSVTPMGLMSAVTEHINEQICRFTYEG
ncbi:MAG: hypothetical protein IKR46_00980 [Clostridia bacterium]|nr:hypothetical protein [Clostridia bacterium]